MGQAELNDATGEVIIRSVFYFYGDAASAALAEQIAADIEAHWNEPGAYVVIKRRSYQVRFEIRGYHAPELSPETVWYNDDPRLNFFRIEHSAAGNISFVDAIGSNTGYLKLGNLLQTSSTIAHEYGHTLGLVHPKVLDIRGGLEPSIMYPRGTLCDPALQYDPAALAAQTGGFLDPRHRKVCICDIQDLRLHKLGFDEKGFAVVGEFSSIYHEKYEEASSTVHE